MSLMERKIIVACFIEHVHMCFADALKNWPNFNLVYPWNLLLTSVGTEACGATCRNMPMCFVERNIELMNEEETLSKWNEEETNRQEKSNHSVLGHG